MIFSPDDTSMDIYMQKYHYFFYWPNNDTNTFVLDD